MAAVLILTGVLPALPVPGVDLNFTRVGRPATGALTTAGQSRHASRVGLRVVYAEDNFLVRAGTAALLEEASDVAVVGVAADATALLEAVEEHAPDAVLTDIRMPPTWTTEGIDAAHRIRRHHPAVGVVVLSQYVEEQYAVDLLSGGAGGLAYLLKERIAQVEELVAALTAVASGGSVLDPMVVDALLARRHVGRDPLTTLSPRELAVLRAMANGQSNQAIGRSLYLSERTVEKNINGIFTKLGVSQEDDVNRRVRAVVLFLQASADG
jgi:DNA-binding NarL/FixJ family response regulator